jgi:hypothetical protein
VRFARAAPNSNIQVEDRRVAWSLEFPPSWGMACPVLNHECMLNPAVVEFSKAKAERSDFWVHILNDEQLRNCDDLEKLVIGCEIIVALDAVDLLAA